jgi:hypothetical protein
MVKVPRCAKPLNVCGYFVGYNLLRKIKRNILIHKTNKTKIILVLIPIFGTILFIVLYIVATLLYPGGSQVDKNSIGFSWMNN